VCLKMRVGVSDRGVKGKGGEKRYGERSRGYGIGEKSLTGYKTEGRNKEQ
jgi:hypothetical protein